MLTFVFFSTVFTSAMWLIYAGMYVNTKIVEGSLFGQAPEEMMLFLAIIILPVLMIWLIFGFINQYVNNKNMNTKQNELLHQLQKNQDYTDLVVRVMLDAEHEIKDGFVINKFDTFIADMNESLGEIIQRCNIASSAQLEQLWQRVRRGEKWTLGKAILDASKSQSTFDAWVKEKLNRDKVFRGTLLEFCSRYQNLLQLLEKHDRDRIFLRIIETGVFGKVYSIIAPISEGITNLENEALNSRPAPEAKKDYASVLRIANMEEPNASETIVNVDKNDNDEETEEEVQKSSIFAKLNPFKKKIEEEIEIDDHEQDPFFKALHNSFSDNQHTTDAVSDVPTLGGNLFSAPVEQAEDLPMNNISCPTIDETEPKLSENMPFNNLRDTLNSLKDTNNSFNAFSSSSEFSAKQNDDNDSLTPTISAQKNTFNETSDKNNKQETEDFVYPFGGWTDEENYNK